LTWAIESLVLGFSAEKIEQKKKKLFQRIFFKSGLFVFKKTNFWIGPKNKFIYKIKVTGLEMFRTIIIFDKSAIF